MSAGKCPIGFNPTSLQIIFWMRSNILKTFKILRPTYKLKLFCLSFFTLSNNSSCYIGNMFYSISFFCLLYYIIIKLSFQESLTGFYYTQVTVMALGPFVCYFRLVKVKSLLELCLLLLESSSHQLCSWVSAPPPW